MEAQGERALASRRDGALDQIGVRLEGVEPALGPGDAHGRDRPAGRIEDGDRDAADLRLVLPLIECEPAFRNHAELAHERVGIVAVSYTHLRAHETGRNLVCRLLLEK